MTERTENEMNTILSQLQLGVSLAPLKKMLKKASVAEKIAEETKNLAVHFTRQTPVHCLLQLVGGDDGESVTIQPLVETKRDVLRFAPDTFVKDHEKTGAEKLYQKFEVDGQCSAALAELEKPHASNVYIVDEKKECVYPLASERGKAMCGTVIVVLARSRGTQAEQIKRIMKSRRVLTEMLRHFDPADTGDASSMDEEDEKTKTKTTTTKKKTKKPVEEEEKKAKKTKRTKSHKESDSEEEQEEASPSVVQRDASSSDSRVDDASSSSEEESSSESSSSSSEESESSGSEKKKKKTKGGKKAEKHKKEKKAKKTKKSVKSDKKPKKSINPTAAKAKKTTPPAIAALPEKKKTLPTPPPPAKKTVPSTSSTSSGTATTTTTTTATTGVRTRPQKAGAPTTLPVTAEERKVAVSEVLQTQQRTEELFQWFQSLPESDLATNTAEISATD